jgi:hypothetical protein
LLLSTEALGSLVRPAALRPAAWRAPFNEAELLELIRALVANNGQRTPAHQAAAVPEHTAQ